VSSSRPAGEAGDVDEADEADEVVIRDAPTSEPVR
jgi:hypothetical protein